MTYTTQTVTGVIHGPAGPLGGATISFRLVGVGTEPGSAIVPGRVDSVTDGAGGLSVDLWSNQASSRGTSYEVVHETGSDYRPRLGLISVPGTAGPHDLSELLDQDIPSETSVVTIVPAPGVSGLVSGDIVLSDSAATFNVPITADSGLHLSGVLTGDAIMSGATDETPGRVVVTRAQGFFGLGGLLPDLADVDSVVTPSGLYHVSPAVTPDGTLPSGFVNGMCIISARGNNGSQIVISDGAKFYVRTYVGGVFGDWYEMVSGLNSIVDTNGFYKEASPVVRVFADHISGAGTLDAAATGLNFSRVDVGEYEISGVSGLAESGWRIELPRDDLRNLIVAGGVSFDSGVITLRVGEPVCTDGVWSVGAPVDIPADAWVDVRISGLTS